MKKASCNDMPGQEGRRRSLFQNHGDLFLLLSSSAFVTSPFFLFAPLQLYITNISELWFRIEDVFWPSMVTLLLLWLGFAVLGFLLYCRKKLFSWYNCLLFGLGLALYIQGNILPMDYGILNGATVEWGAYQNKAVMNALLWLVCMALPFALARFLPRWSNAIIRYLCCGLVLIQLITTGTLCVTTDFSKSAATDVFLSDKGLYEVSSDKNVIVFILDTLDKRFFEEVYDQDSNLVDFMDGFTYFSNMTSAYPNTRPSLPYILTGQHYLNEQPYTDYIVEAWENCADYYQTLCDSGFTTSIYTEDYFISGPAKVEWVDNAVGDNVAVSSYIGMEKALLRFTAMRFFPDGLKKYIWSSTDLFSGLKAIDSDYKLFSEDTAVFMERLLETGLTASDQNQYHVIHLEGAHMPYTLRADCTEDENAQTSAGEETEGCLTMLREYVRQLKELGVYDDTCIIVTGDHGFSDISKTSPVLFVKGMGQSGAMQIDDRPVSHENMMGTVMKEIRATEDARYGRSVFDVSASETGYRKYYLYTQNDSYDRNYMPDMVEYDILPENNNTESFILTGRVYTDEGVTESEPYSYVIGEPVTFQDSEALSYFVSGIPGYVDEDGVWSSGHSGRACFHTGMVDSDLLCRIQLSSYVQNGAQHVIISAGGQTLYDDTVTTNLSYINFAVPKECIIEGMLILDFDYPDACSSISIGTSDEDARDIAIKFWSIAFSLPERTGTIDFTQDGNAGGYYISGWHGMEAGGSWTSESASIIAVLQEAKDTNVSVTYKTHPGANSTSVYYNGEYVGVLPHHDDFAPETLVLPASNCSGSGVQTITFVTDGATTSKEYFGGDEADTRVLGIAVSEITVVEVS